MSIASLVVASYKHIYIDYNLSKLIVIKEDFDCNVCHNPHLSFNMNTFEQWLILIYLSKVFLMYFQGQSLQTLVRMSKEEFHNLSREQQMKILTSLQIKRTF